MSLVSRAIGIITQPKNTWYEIKGEQATVGSLYTSYAMILALIGPVATFIGLSLIGRSAGIFGTIRIPIGTGIVHLIVGYALALVGVYVSAMVINLLAPQFSSRQDLISAMKLVVYSMTPGWIGAVLTIIPALGILGILFALYGLYILYLGLPIMMETPSDKVVVYLIVSIVVIIVVTVIIGLITGLILGGAMVATRM